MASRTRRHRSHRRWWNREIANTPYWFLIAAGIAFIVIGGFIAIRLI